MTSQLEGRTCVAISITNQYQPRGILFGGDSPFISPDRSNPTSPVLSGTPLFNGAITGTFVKPDGTKRKVAHFSLDVGYIDDPGSVTVTAYSASGSVLKAVNIDQTGIVPVTVKVAGISSFQVAEVSADTAGFAIDNVVYPKALSLAALGDSYSSGEGNPPFIKAAGDCDRSSAAWPTQLGKLDESIPDVTDIACSGAHSSALTQIFKGQASQTSQLTALMPATDLVTLTIGGNDVDFSGILADCFKPFRNCVSDGRLKTAESDVQAELPTLVGDYNAVQAAAKQATVKYVSTLGVLHGHELCTEDPWVFEIGYTGGASRGHPTFFGQGAIEHTVQSYLDSLPS
jgi:hypothetical protein